MALFKRRDRGTQQLLISYMSPSGVTLPGYTRLVDAPEIASGINRIAMIVSAATIYQLQHTADGDIRVHDALTRLVDIDPMPGRGSRSLLMGWIVTTLLGDGDGNAFVYPHVSPISAEFSYLEPMPGAIYRPIGDARQGDYYVEWNGKRYDKTEVLHFRLFADPDQPTKGRGIKVQAQAVAHSLENAGALKSSLTSPDYKPPLAVSVDSDSPLDDPEERENFRKAYLADTGDGKPWIIPAGLMKIEQIRPLSLADLAIKDTIELDKRTACGILGLPPFMLGLGGFNEREYNLFVQTFIVPLCAGIEQELTLKLQMELTKFFRFSRRRLYNYDLKTLIDIDLAMADRGYLNGDEVREDADRDPAGLTEFKVLENYIPWDMSGQQNKLNHNKEDETNAE